MLGALSGGLNIGEGFHFVFLRPNSSAGDEPVLPPDLSEASLIRPPRKKSTDLRVWRQHYPKGEPKRGGLDTWNLALLVLLVLSRECG